MRNKKLFPIIAATLIAIASCKPVKFIQVCEMMPAQSMKMDLNGLYFENNDTRWRN